MSVDEQFTKAFSRITRGWAVIGSLRKVALAGMPYAARVVDGQHKSLMADLTASGQLEKFIIGIKDSQDLQKTADFLREKLTEQTLKNASYSVDAASLVFAHTVLDDALNSFLEITSEVARDFWTQRVKKNKIELESLIDRGLDNALSSIIDKEVSTIRRNDSMVKRAELLHAICQPSGGSGHPHYKFEPEKVREIDKLRQDIVHGELLGGEIPEIEGNLTYLDDTSMYFFVMMHKSFGLRIDPAMLTPADSSCLLSKLT